MDNLTSTAHSVFFVAIPTRKKLPTVPCLYLILFKNRPIVPDATLDQVDPLVDDDDDDGVSFITLKVIGTQ